jgi:intein/homing endonuclease
MADGTVRNIEDIYLDDIVMAYNPQTNEFVPKKVIDGYTHHNTARIVEVTFSDGTILKMTPSHPILTTKGWRSLDPIISLDEHGILPGWLEIGDSVISYNGEVQITDIQELSVPKNFDTYDFEVEDCHTFLAEGIPVHNAMITGPAASMAD